MVSFDFNAETGTMTAKFSGRMDTLAIQKISESLEIHLPKKDQIDRGAIIFDLAEVDYIASSFIRICVQMAKEAGPGRFSIINTQPFVKKTFKISGLDEVLRVL